MFFVVVFFQVYKKGFTRSFILEILNLGRASTEQRSPTLFLNTSIFSKRRFFLPLGIGMRTF